MIANLTPKQIRKKIRLREWTGTTYGVAKEYAQVSPVIVSKQYVDDFYQFCLKNPKFFPLYGVSQAGETKLPFLGDDVDITLDLGSYSIIRNGKFECATSTVKDIWQDDFVTFAIGCSLSFEEILWAYNIPLKHTSQSKKVPIYRTNIQLNRVGVFSGLGMVTMRQFSKNDAIKSIALTAQFPKLHGSPIHLGNSDDIGIENLLKPDYGDVPELSSDDFPLYWACGMTIFNVMEEARLPVSIVVDPGHMLVTDKLVMDLREVELQNLC